MKDTGTRVCICFLLETGWFQKRNEGPSLNGMDLFFCKIRVRISRI